MGAACLPDTVASSSGREQLQGSGRFFLGNDKDRDNNRSPKEQGEATHVLNTPTGTEKTKQL